MKAARFSQFGGPEVLEIVDLPDPHAGPGQIRVAVHAVGVNPTDWKLRKGLMGGERADPAVARLRRGRWTARRHRDGHAHPGRARRRGREHPARQRRRGRSRQRCRPARRGARRARDRHRQSRQPRLPALAGRRARRLRRGPCRAGSRARARRRRRGARRRRERRPARAHRASGRPSARRDARRLQWRAGARSGVQQRGRRRAVHALAEIGDLIESGRFSLQVAQTFPLAEIAAAHRVSEEGHARGKLVLLVG